MEPLENKENTVSECQISDWSNSLYQEYAENNQLPGSLTAFKLGIAAALKMLTETNVGTIVLEEIKDELSK